MKNLLLLTALICIANISLAQNPCYIKYTYDASGNRIKREFVCAPVDTLIVIDGDTMIDDNGGGIARMQNPNPPTNNKDASFTCNITPNPTAGKFMISITGDLYNMNAEVYTSAGQKIFSFPIVNENTSVDLQNRTVGVYYVIIKSNSKKVFTKVVKNE